ncbi:MAG: hypothetical protein KDE19_08850 [Caldilineaceae bacterium]|nr:hypothetical protein [Caldilineaceae bacterium]
MSQQIEPTNWRIQLVWWLLYSVSWVGSSALALWLMLQLRINLIDLNNALGWGPWILIGVDKFGFLLLGLGWLIGVFVIEMYLRAGSSVTDLAKRSRTVFLVVIGGNLLSYLLQWLLL